MAEPITVDIKVNKEGVDDAVRDLKEACDDRPNITIRNNNNVYVTMNYYNETEKEHHKEDE